MIVPFLDVGAAYHEIQEELEDAILRCLRSGWYIGGRDVEAFEQSYASFTETQHCVGVANGLDALHVSLLAMDVQPGDEVIVPSNTFIATWLAVSQCGAIPVPVEPVPGTYNLDPDRVESSITSKTKVVLPVHLYGQPADLDPILQIARAHGLRVLEDAAQAHGARYKGRRIGGHGDVVAWSFYPGKNLGALGDAGAITTNNAELAGRIRSLGNYGSKEKYVHEVRGFNSRLDPVHAAVLATKLKYLDEWNARRASIAARYLEELADLPLSLPYSPAWAGPVWHLFVIQCEQRDRFRDKLHELGIGTLIHYPIPPHLQEAYGDAGYTRGAFPIAEAMADRLLSLPIGPQLDGASVERVIAAVRAAV